MTIRTIPEFSRTEIEIIDESLVITQTTDGNDYSISIPIVFADEFVRLVRDAIEDGKNQQPSEADIEKSPSTCFESSYPLSNKNGI